MSGGGDINVFVAGSVITEGELVEQIRRELLRVGRINDGTGIRR